MKRKLFKALSIMLAITTISSSVDFCVFAENNVTASISSVSDNDIEIIDEEVSNAKVTPDYQLRKPSGTKNNASWSGIYFGHYPQSDTNNDGLVNEADDEEPILWRVLDVDNTTGEALLMSNAKLDLKPYNTTDEKCTWETCTLRSWLNGYSKEINIEHEDYTECNFIDKAFTKDEQKSILVSDVETNDRKDTYYGYTSYGGNPVKDKIYLLSYEEAIDPGFGFDNTNLYSDVAKELKDTDLVFQTYKELQKDNSITRDYTWIKFWLRSPEHANRGACACQSDGGVMGADFPYSNDDKVAVCPIMKIDLSKSNWEYAGVINYRGKIIEKENVKVLFDANGGLVDVSEREKVLKHKYGILPVPVRDGYVFKGWYTEKENGDLITKDSYVLIEDEHTLYAHWIAVSDGLLANPIIREDGMPIYDTVYFGKYWQNDTNKDNKADKNDNKELIKWRVLEVKDDNVLLLADNILDVKAFNNDATDVSWENSSLRAWLNDISKDGNGFITTVFSQNEIDDIVQNDDKDKVFILNENQIKNSDYGFNTSSQKDDNARKLEVTKYVSDTYSLTDSAWWLRADNGNGKIYYVLDGTQVMDGADCTDENIGVLPAIIVNKDSACLKYAGKITPENDLQNIDYSVIIFDANGGAFSSIAEHEKIVRIGSEYGSLPVPVYDEKAYIFEGWYTEKEGGRRVTDVSIVSDVNTQILYAHYISKKIIVSFDMNGGYLDNKNTSKEVLIGDSYGELPVPTKAYNIFDGWYTKPEGGTLVTENTTVDMMENHSIYAHWKPMTIKITFDSCGGISLIESKDYPIGKKIETLPVATKTGYEFIGWFTEKEKGTHILDDHVFDTQQDITLYAHYKELSIKVIFDGNGGNVDTEFKNIAATDVYGELPIPVRNKYVFAGWYTEKKGGKKIEAIDRLMYLNEHILYAHWENINLVVKQKYNIKNYFKEVNHIVGYQVESSDGGKIKVSKNGGLTAIKEGTVKIVPLVKVGKEKIPEKNVEPLILIIKRPYADKKILLDSSNTKINMNSYYKGIPVNSNVIKWSCSNKKIAEINEVTGELNFHKPGKVKVTLMITNDQGKTIKLKNTVILSK